MRNAKRLDYTVSSAAISPQMQTPSRSGPRPSGDRRRLPGFFWLSLTLGVAFSVLFAALSVRAVRERGLVRDDGWSQARADDGWIVSAVEATGPAADLSPGDRIAAVDGDARASRIGAAWQVRGLEPGEAYALTVDRDGRPLTVTLTARSQPGPDNLPWILIYLAVALANFVVAMMLALVRPEDRMVQFASAGLLLTAGFMLWIALGATSALRQDPFVLALGLTFPWYYVAGYLFFARFPHVFPASRGWTAVTWLVVLGGAALWAGRSVAPLIGLLPIGPRLALADRLDTAIAALRQVTPLGDLLFVVCGFGAMFAVLWRNYRRLPEGSDRRRVKIVALGQSLALVPAGVSAAAGALAVMAGAGPVVLGAVTLGKQAANALAIAAPVSFGYAIVAHHVLGFRMAVRLGIQYVLAQNALRTAVLLPLVWLTYTAVVHPDRAIGEILFAGYGRFNLAVLVLAGIGLQYRSQIAAGIDRRFFRAAYDHEGILRRLAESVKAADSLAEVAELAAREIDAALQVTRVLIFYHDPRAGEFSVGYSSQAMPARSPLSDESALLREIERDVGARSADDLRTRIPPGEAVWLDGLGVDLVVPLTGVDRNLVGALMLGEKRSEEPFTSPDRRLLQTVAAQIGAVYEVLTLRERVSRQGEIQAEVLASVDARRINLVKECPACGRCYDRIDERCAADGVALVLSLPVERTIDGKYRLDRLIGRGGMGAVYEAVDLRLNRHVAVKVIKGSSFHSTSARRRFAREAQACARLSHPNTIRVYDYGAFENQSAYLVMEYVAGRSWRAELDRLGTFAPGATADLLDQVCAGMEAAHAAGILHRDLKPDNLVISSDGAGPPRVRILDFGLAKVRESSFVDPKSRTVAGLAMGTLGYMSPEQLAAQEVDERTDVYALGVVAFESLTGPLPPFGAHFHPVIEAEVARRLRQPARTAAHRALADAIERALASDTSKRFASIAELRAALIPAIRACEDMPMPVASGVPTGAVPESAEPAPIAERHDAETRIAGTPPSPERPS